MSDDTNYVRVGQVTFEHKGLVAGSDTRQTAYVGIRADLGRVAVGMNGGYSSLPLMSDSEAEALGELLAKAAAALPKIMAAHKAYRDAAATALQDFEQAVTL